MEKILVSLLIIKTVFSLECYLTDIKNPGLNKVQCKTYEKSCAMAEVIFGDQPDTIVVGRMCTIVDPNTTGQDPDIEEKSCKLIAMNLTTITHCSIAFCYTDLCNEYVDLTPKPMSEYNEPSDSAPRKTEHPSPPSRVTVNHPYKMPLLFAVMFCVIK